MSLNRFLLRLGASALLLLGAAPTAFAGEIQLLECLPDGTCSVPAGNTPFDAFNFYFNAIYPWLIGCAAGIALLWALWGGIIMMSSGGDPGKRSEGTQKLTQALTGLLMIIFAAMILHFLNPTFYR